MPYPTDTEVTVVRVPRAVAVPPAALTGGDVTTIDNRLATLEAGEPLNDLTDVNTAGVVNGNTLIYDLTTGMWLVGDPSGAIAEVSQTGTLVRADVTSLNFGADSFEVEASVATPGRVNIVIGFAGTGLLAKVARSDHSHTALVGKRRTFAETGVLSSGTRSLVNTTVGPFAAGITYDLEARFTVRARNNVNSGTFNLLCRVGADAAYPQVSRNVQTVGGVPVDQHVEFGDIAGANSGAMVVVGTGNSLTVTFDAQFSLGDPVDLRNGFWSVTARPRR